MGEPSEGDTARVLQDLRGRFVPNQVLACRGQSDPAAASPALMELFQGKEVSSEGPVAYVCQNFTCGPPAVGKAAILAAWREL